MNIMFGFSMLNTIEGHVDTWVLMAPEMQVDALSCQFYSHTSLIWVHDTGFFDVNVHVARASMTNTH